jgi:hypothetical protein
MLYTITTDGTVRVFLPVLDQPNYLQLHGALDTYSPLPLSSHPFSPKSSALSTGFILDREVVCAAFTRILNDRNENDDSGLRRLREIQDEGWDLFLHVHEDRSLVVGAVAVRTSFFRSKLSDWITILLAEYRPKTSDSAEELHTLADPSRHSRLLPYPSVHPSARRFEQADADNELAARELRNLSCAVL